MRPTVRRLLTRLLLLLLLVTKAVFCWRLILCGHSNWRGRLAVVLPRLSVCLSVWTMLSTGRSDVRQAGWQVGAGVKSISYQLYVWLTELTRSRTVSWRHSTAYSINTADNNFAKKIRVNNKSNKIAHSNSGTGRVATPSDRSAQPPPRTIVQPYLPGAANVHAHLGFI